MTAVSERID